MATDSHFSPGLSHPDAHLGTWLGSPAALDYGDSLVEYAALMDNSGVVDVSARTQIELTGEDRAKFLHNLCSNDILRLQPGNGCEAFFLDAKGHVLAFCWLFVGESSVVLETVPDSGERLAAHLDRYLIRERVVIADRTAEWGELLVAGKRAAALLQQLGATPPVADFTHAQAQVGGADVWLRRVSWVTAEGWLVAVERARLAHVWQSIIEAGAAPVGASALESARLERGTPYYGIDISDKNLPQEVNRDATAINFNKGCYIGQETVARIDALGHVNQLLVSARFSGDQLPAGTDELRSNAQSVGQITSVAWSPALSRPLALAYVRQSLARPGVMLESDSGSAEVVALPLRT